MADNDEQHNQEFETAGSGASATYPMQCRSTSKTGKHGHAKVHLVAVDIFTGKKLEDISPSTHNMVRTRSGLPKDVPNVTRNEYLLLNIDENFLNLMLADGGTKDDVMCPEGELGEKIRSDFAEGKELMVTVIAAMGEECAISYKQAAS
ncbi:MAG: eukaryotic translation initiation factor 5A-2 [Olpidium bornovanus]|uniref:Eukaryotic translation initiation factor 5A n=1 Tax=Olpidium bornovanus TaxID=278681 RepID=A0A8H7ZV28_9FUNG|nr:MAG: eukaryotic translation initiation factor 5A-2 [Olpidium bornovanus]